MSLKSPTPIAIMNTTATTGKTIPVGSAKIIVSSENGCWKATVRDNSNLLPLWESEYSYYSESEAVGAAIAYISQTISHQFNLLTQKMEGLIQMDSAIRTHLLSALNHQWL